MKKINTSIYIRHHFIREHVKNKEIKLISSNINDQVADIFTKLLKIKIFIILKFMLAWHEIS